MRSYQNIVILFSAFVIIGCSSTPKVSRVELPKSKAASSIQKKIVESAKKRLGIPYCYGGVTPKCMDCSGFVVTIFNEIGIILPRSSAQQFTLGKAVDDEDATIGDLIFFKGKSGTINHVGIYVGNNTVVHASSSRGVIIQPLSDTYLSNGYAGIRRFLPDEAIN